MFDHALIASVACASLEEARRIGRILVEERLAACVHIHPHEAIYRWQNAIESADEGTLLATTTRTAFARLRDRVLELHSHDVPGIVATPIVDGHGPFLDWVAAEVA